MKIIGLCSYSHSVIENIHIIEPAEVFQHCIIEVTLQDSEQDALMKISVLL